VERGPPFVPSTAFPTEASSGRGRSCKQAKASLTSCGRIDNNRRLFTLFGVQATMYVTNTDVYLSKRGESEKYLFRALLPLCEIG
jgi:hypothetical protein